MGNDLKYGLVLGVVVLLIFVGYMAIKARGHKETEPAVAATTASSPTAATSATSTGPIDMMAPPSDTASSASPAGIASSATTGTTTAPGIGTGTQLAGNNTSQPSTVSYEFGKAPAPAPAPVSSTVGVGGPAATGAKAPGMSPMPGGSQVAVRPNPVGTPGGVTRPSGMPSAPTGMQGQRPGATGMTAPAPRPGGGIITPTVGQIPPVSPSIMPSQDLGAAPRPQPVAINQKTYTIAKGDLLADIAKKNYGDASKWQKIVDANKGLDPNRLKVGQKIVLPDLAPDADDSKTPALGGSAPKPSDITAASGKTYTVAKGDNLYKIATKAYGDGSKWKKILDANKSTLSSPEKLKVGMKLTIPQ